MGESYREKGRSWDWPSDRRSGREPARLRRSWFAVRNLTRPGLRPAERLANQWILWACVVVSTSLGILVVAACSRHFGQITLAGVQRWLLMSAVVLCATALAAAPCISFLLHGWAAAAR